MAKVFPYGIPFGGYTSPIVPGGYAVVGKFNFEIVKDFSFNSLDFL